MVKLNTLLGQLGVAPVASHGDKKMSVKLSSHIYKAKRQLKGVEWLSDLNRSTEEVDAFLKEEIRKMSWSSEFYENILPDVENFIEGALAAGHLHENDVKFFSNNLTRELLTRREEGQKVPKTPGLLLIDFVTDVANVSDEINKWVVELSGRLRANGENRNLELESQRWIVERARARFMLSKEEDDALAMVFDRKDRIMAYYKGQADLFKAGNSPYADALAFALLWREVMRSESNRAKKADQEILNQEIENFFVATGVNPRGNETLKAEIKARAPKYQYRKLSSVLTLFPTGALSFLKYAETKELTQYIKPAQALTGFFVHEAISAEKIAEIKAKEGRTVVLKDGRILGTQFRFDPTEYSKSGVSQTNPRRKMMMENYNQDYVRVVCEGISYSKGGKAFVGDYQLATIAYVETTTQAGKPMSSGVVLWLQNVRQVSKQELVEILQSQKETVNV